MPSERRKFFTACLTFLLLRKWRLHSADYNARKKGNMGVEGPNSDNKKARMAFAVVQTLDDSFMLQIVEGSLISKESTIIWLPYLFAAESTDAPSRKPCPVDETKDYIELTSKLNSINDILKELDNLQNEYCALPDKIESNNSLDILSDMEEDEEKFKICSSFHNTKLHRDKTDVSIPSTAEGFTDTAPKVNSEQCFALRSTDNKNSKPMKYLMSTAVAYVNGMPVRIILDSASEINFISSDCAMSLGLKRNRIHSSVSSINGLAQDIKYETNAIISNKDNSFNESLKFMVVPKISPVTPSCNLDISKLSLPKHIKLADPSFHKPAKISMLLGAQVFFKIIKADQIKINDSITLQNSVFNSIVTGGLPTADDKLHCFLLSE
ncbi:hypothetical protein AVEN_15878-1 [Araneus ventricosus]|uniref:Uncharacterized protein n=1 Tax=Araneus ventricosus TaxID=182803 RepID=A0A4Y2S3G1_ARAVE|nr:hypothetical protein AVEN_254992-1 [Araneus ventricosus]GBN82453.1 hypothetical protein AVEN_15878-1 [Araneus ventricosus]